MASEPFQHVLDTLERLEKEDPKLAFQAARLVGIYRRLWESCFFKNIDVQRLETANQELRADNAQLYYEEDQLKRRQNAQIARLLSFEQALGNVRQRLLDALKDWNSACVAEHQGSS